jgi:hypothetical protein
MAKTPIDMRENEDLIKEVLGFANLSDPELPVIPKQFAEGMRSAQTAMLGFLVYDDFRDLFKDPKIHLVEFLIGHRDILPCLLLKPEKACDAIIKVLRPGA